MKQVGKAWKLKDVLMIAIVGVLFSFVYLGAVYLGMFLTSALTPFGWGAIGYEPWFGIWYMAAAFAAYVIRKPGAGIVAEIIASVLEVLMGNTFGPMVIVSGLIQGFGIELGFMLFKYKRFDFKVVSISTVTAVIVSFIWNTFRNQYYLYGANVLIVMLVIRFISAFIFAGVITKLLADRLAKAGVLNAYPIGQALMDDEE